MSRSRSTGWCVDARRRRPNAHILDGDTALEVDRLFALLRDAVDIIRIQVDPPGTDRAQTGPARTNRARPIRLRVM
jgi:hypothetical protein